MSDQSLEDRTVKVEGSERSLLNIANQLQETVGEDMSDEARDDIARRLDQILDLKCKEHGERPEFVSTDKKGLRIETCCDQLMNDVHDTWAA